MDSSVLLAACGSSRGASRAILARAEESDWTIVTSPYVLEEVLTNIVDLPTVATAEWARLRRTLTLVDDVWTLDRMSIFESSKDRPILYTAAAWSDVLLTLDRRDFGPLIGQSFYGLLVLTPGMFLQQLIE